MKFDPAKLDGTNLVEMNCAKFLANLVKRHADAQRLDLVFRVLDLGGLEKERYLWLTLAWKEVTGGFPDGYGPDMLGQPMTLNQAAEWAFATEKVLDQWIESLSRHLGVKS